MSGKTNVDALNANLGGTLQAGYTQYSSLSYDVTNTAEVSGTNTITFAVHSVTDQNTFNNLRVFHLEPDKYSTAEIKWVDRTVLSPDPAAPDFVNKTINVKANTLGQFVVAALTSPQPPNTATADLRVTINDSPDGVMVANNLTYTVTVANSGHRQQTA